MKAILSELRAADQFSLIDFNHNVRCWRDNLVSATPSQVEDAKKYIQTIHPNGGMRFWLQELLTGAAYHRNGYLRQHSDCQSIPKKKKKQEKHA